MYFKSDRATPKCLFLNLEEIKTNSLSLALLRILKEKNTSQLVVFNGMLREKHFPLAFLSLLDNKLQEAGAPLLH